MHTFSVITILAMGLSACGGERSKTERAGTNYTAPAPPKRPRLRPRPRVVAPAARPPVRPAADAPPTDGPPGSKVNPCTWARDFGATYPQGVYALEPGGGAIMTDQFGKDHYAPLGYVPVCEPPMLRCYYVSPKTFQAKIPLAARVFEGAGVRVSVKKESPSKKACLKFEAGSSVGSLDGKPKWVTVNRVRFLRALYGGGGLGHQFSDEVYRTFHARRCIELRLRYVQKGHDPPSATGRAHAILELRIRKTLASVLRGIDLDKLPRK